ncbi:MAG: hypothetical protein ABI840_09110 [bacterium]
MADRFELTISKSFTCDKQASPIVLNNLTLTVINKKINKKIIYSQTEYIVYIIIDKNKNAHIKISDNGRFVFKAQMERFGKLVYFEKFLERTKALRKKRYLCNLGQDNMLKLIKKKNPEMLNLIFTIFDSCETLNAKRETLDVRV